MAAEFDGERDHEARGTEKTIPIEAMAPAEDTVPEVAETIPVAPSPVRPIALLRRRTMEFALRDLYGDEEEDSWKVNTKSSSVKKGAKDSSPTSEGSPGTDDGRAKKVRSPLLDEL